MDDYQNRLLSQTKTQPHPPNYVPGSQEYPSLQYQPPRSPAVIYNQPNYGHGQYQGQPSQHYQPYYGIQGLPNQGILGPVPNTNAVVFSGKGYEYGTAALSCTVLFKNAIAMVVYFILKFYSLYYFLMPVLLVQAIMFGITWLKRVTILTTLHDANEHRYRKTKRGFISTFVMYLLFAIFILLVMNFWKWWDYKNDMAQFSIIVAIFLAPRAIVLGIVMCLEKGWRRQVILV